MAVLGSHPVFLRQKVLGQRLGFGVGHIHERSDPAFERGQGLGSDIALIGQSGLPEMHLVVDDAGQHISPFQVDFLIRPRKGFLLSHRPYPGNSIRCPFDTSSRSSPCCTDANGIILSSRLFPANRLYLPVLDPDFPLPASAFVDQDRVLQQIIHGFRILSGDPNQAKQAGTESAPEQFLEQRY